jgi:hypothetical protein
MPLHLGWPSARLQQVVEAARPCLIIHGPPAEGGGAGPAPVSGCMQMCIVLAGLQNSDAGVTITVEPFEGGLSSKSGDSGERGVHKGAAHGRPCLESSGARQAAARCCYVMFTSGSTGRPLGVCGLEAGESGAAGEGGQTLRQ